MVLQIIQRRKESAEEWMGNLGIKANECSYKEHFRWLKEQCINGINDEMMTAKIIKDLTIMQKKVKLQAKSDHRSTESPESNAKNCSRK